MSEDVETLDKALLIALQGAAAEGPPVELDPETASAIRRVLARVPKLEELLTDFVIDANYGGVNDWCHSIPLELRTEANRQNWEARPAEKAS